MKNEPAAAVRAFNFVAFNSSFNFESFFYDFLFLPFVVVAVAVTNKRPVIDFLMKFHAKICLHYNSTID